MPSASATDDPEIRSHPRVRPPERTRSVVAAGLRLAVHEWGDPEAPPLMLVHGGFDFARTFDVFAPLLAEAGWRVVAWDQRGHGDSDHAALYQWEADIKDAVCVFDSVSAEAVAVVGHSKGGSLMSHLAAVMPWRVSVLVNIDGIPGHGPVPEIQDHDRTKLLAADLADWLDRRRRMDGAQRRPGTIAELAERRGRQNPRLSREWLEYLVTVGARRDADGWRWKIDPTLRMGGFGPWRPEWARQRFPDISCPFLAILATEAEMMGWPTTKADCEPFLPPQGRAIELADTGHFVHIERPDEVAAMVLEHLEQVR